MKTLYYGGRILTMEQQLYAEAVLADDEKILAVGNLAELEKQAGTCERVNLGGATLMPAFIDPHSHFFQVAGALMQVSVLGADSAEEIGSRIRTYIADNQIAPGEWVTARDYDNNIMPGLKNPTLEQLDSFAPENPLVIYFKSGHMGLMNSAAFRFLGITAETPSPDGGRFEVRDGKLTGYLEENAFFDSLKKVPMASPALFLNAFDGAQKEYASHGITVVQDGMVVEQMLPMYEMLMQQDRIYLDVRLFSGVDSYDNTVKILKKYPDNGHIRNGGMKMFLDGSPQGRTAWMRTPYQGDDRTYCGYPTMTDEAVIAAFEQAAKKHAQIIAHCNGDAAAEQFLRCLEKAEQKHPELKELRPVIIHGQLMGTDQLARARDLGAMVSFFVAHVYHWGDVHIRNFGFERASQISPVRSALDAGLKVTFHQDAPVIEPDMLETVWCAVNRITKDGVSLGENQKVSVLEALRAVTGNAAFQYSEEAVRGSLAPGKKADFVVLSADPLETPAADIRKIQVLKTYKNNRCIYSRS